MIHQLLAAAGSAVLTASAAFSPPPAPPSSAPPLSVIKWVQRHAVPIASLEEPLSDAEIKAISRLTRGARIVALGEPGHGAYEPLAYRNRLIRHLVEHGGFTAVALESGITETRKVGDYVLGGPGDAAKIVADNLSWDFGQLVANVELVTWMRAFNSKQPHRQVHLYGVDISGGDNSNSMGRSRIALEALTGYLSKTVPGESRDIRATIATFGERFTPEAYATYSAADRELLWQAVVQARALFARHRQTMVGLSSLDDEAWAERIAIDCQRLVEVFRVWPDADNPLPLYVQQFAKRDLAMADNLMWALEREGPHGRILLFQSDAHISVTPLKFGAWRDYAVLPQTVGGHLRARLGNAYRNILVSSAVGKSAQDDSLGSIDRAMAEAGRPALLLDIRPTRKMPWWTDDQSIVTNRRMVSDVVPAAAADAILFFQTLTDAPRQSVSNSAP